jgi:hypothetical protein
MQNPNSMAARIIGAKYYQQSTFLEATLEKRPSFTCRSLMPACDVLKNGLIWRVGDGSDIRRIWGNKWLPSPTSFSIQSLHRILAVNTRLKELINQDTKWWNYCLIKEIFSAKEAHIVYQIPLSLVKVNDTLIWRGTMNGVLSVRSTYHIDKELQALRRNGSSRQGVGTLVWKIDLDS